MDASPQLTESATVILDLNDDCLLEVFEFLDPYDLTAIADVCTKFRQNAVRSARLKCEHKYIGLCINSPVYCYSKLRNFGAFAKMVYVDGFDCGKESRAKYQKCFIELLNQYCTGTSINLTIWKFYFTDEIALLMQPSLARIRKLLLIDCVLGESIMKNLSLQSPELRELTFECCGIVTECVMPSEYLRTKFQKLESISYQYDEFVDNIIIIGEILKQNQQLKQIEMDWCAKIDDDIFQSIVKYVPGMEKIAFCSERVQNKECRQHQIPMSIA